MPTDEKSVKDSFGGVGTSFSVESVASDVVEKDKFFFFFFGER